MSRRAILICWTISSVVPLWAQSRPQIDANSQPAVNALSAIARTIKECPRALSSEKKWGKAPAEIERWYVGPPQNVVWDVMPSSSVRTPYIGYIEFSLPETYWVPDEVKDKFMRSDAGSSAELAHLVDPGPMKYRYEFDLGPGGLDLTKMLKGRDPAQRVDDSPDATCWQNAARSVRVVSNQATTPNPVTNGDVRQRADDGNGFLEKGSAAVRADDGEQVSQHDMIGAGYCLGYLLGFADAESLSSALEGNKPLLCLPKQGLRNLQAARMVTKWLKDHPSELHKNGRISVVVALKEAFPCP